jgi:protein-disulfide isomerase
MTRRKSENIKLTMPVSESRDHIQGPPTAPVILLEYGDYECPYCAQAYIIIKEAQERLGSKLRFVFRNFPVTNLACRCYIQYSKDDQISDVLNFGAIEKKDDYVVTST